MRIGRSREDDAPAHEHEHEHEHGPEAAAEEGVRKPDVVHERLHRQHGRITALENEMMRVSTQVAALEERLEDLAARLELPKLDATDAERAEARSLVEEVRREHAQVRARISAAVRFEERLRQVEERLGLGP